MNESKSTKKPAVKTAPKPAEKPQVVVRGITLKDGTRFEVGTVLAPGTLSVAKLKHYQQRGALVDQEEQPAPAPAVEEDTETEEQVDG